MGKTARARALLFGLLLSSASAAGCGPASGARPPFASAEVGASAGCRGAAGLPTGPDGIHSITVDGQDHQYLLTLPRRTPPRTPAPLVIEFHGYGETPTQMADLTQMAARGAARGDVVVTPEGPGETWQLSGRGRDAHFVETLLVRLEDSLCLDLSRVDAAGFSQGAAFAVLFACAHADQVAAISTVAVEFRLGCSTPMPILAFHGTADPAVPYQDGAVGISLPGVRVRGTLLNMGDWARLDGCASTPRTTRIGSDIERADWPGCAGRTAVRLYSVLGGGHTWPGARRATSGMYTTETISATDLALGFFARHPLAEPFATTG